MFHSNKLNEQINNTHETALLLFQDWRITDSSFTYIHHRNYQSLWHTFQPLNSSKKEVEPRNTAPWCPPEGKFWILGSRKVRKMNCLGPFALPNYPYLVEFWIAFAIISLSCNNKNFNNSLLSFTTLFMILKIINCIDFQIRSYSFFHLCQNNLYFSWHGSTAHTEVGSQMQHTHLISLLAAKIFTSSL